MTSFLQRMTPFFKHEAAGGLVLLLAAAVAMGLANSGMWELYDNTLHHFHLTHIINDGLMAVFFLMVGLEIKREMVVGALSSLQRALLPLFMALGGMIVPAALFWILNQDRPEHLSGWAIPSATDIAFALGVLALLGNRVPGSLKVLLLAVAVIDDLGAIVIIAVFYADGVSVLPLVLAAVAALCLFALNRRGVNRIWPYLLFGLCLWAAMLPSGIHATLAGVITALFVPVKGPGAPAHTLEERLHPGVTFAILPLFALANAGVPLGDMGWGDVLHPVTLGIIAGLFLGKQIGIFVTYLAAVALRLCPRPEGAGWGQVYGISLLCGIGFTMSLFIGGLAYETTDLQAHVRMGVLGGSFLSAVAGYAVLRMVKGRV